MQFLDYVHACCLVGVVAYLWKREPPRLLLSPLTLLGFFVLYGVGTIVYFSDGDAVQDVRDTVSLCLILMWICLILGMELARATLPRLTDLSTRNVRAWSRLPLQDTDTNNQLLAAVGIVVTLFMLTMFLAMGKPGQILSFFSMDSVREKQQFRFEHGGQGGYLYQMLLVCIAPFLSFLLLLKGVRTRSRSLLLIAIALALILFAAKVGTFQKIIWVVYLLQLVIVYQASRRLEFGLGRVLALLVVLLVGAAAAAFVALPDLEFGRITEWLAYRIFEVNDEVVYQTFYVYPDHLPHTWGMNIGLVHAIFGSGELTSSYVQVANFFGAENATFDAFYIADAWVDFSFAGVIAMSLMVGFVVKAVDVYATSLGKSAIAVALLASGMYGLFELMVTSAFTAFLSGGLVFIPLLVMLSDGLVADLTHRRAQWQR